MLVVEEVAYDACGTGGTQGIGGGAGEVLGPVFNGRGAVGGAGGVHAAYDATGIGGGVQASVCAGFTGGGGCTTGGLGFLECVNGGGGGGLHADGASVGWETDAAGFGITIICAHFGHATSKPTPSLSTINSCWQCEQLNMMSSTGAGVPADGSEELAGTVRLQPHARLGQATTSPIMSSVAAMRWPHILH